MASLLFLRKVIFVFLGCNLLIFNNFLLYAQQIEQKQNAEQKQTSIEQKQTPEKEFEYAGEFFGIKVPKTNYLFVKSTLQVFGYRGRPPAKNEEELEDQIWEQLLLSFIAFQREINVSQQDLENEIERLLKVQKVDFDFRKDKDKYEQWVKEKTNEPVVLFENQLRHLLQLEKLKEKMMEEIPVEVTEEEAHQEFLNEYNTLSVELVEFSNIKEAEDFYNKVKRRPKIWDKEKEKRPKDFKRPGFVSLEFLIDIWKFPKDACYEMLKLKKDQFYKPSPIYKGYAVFKVLEKRLANEQDFAKLKNGYYEQIRQRKKIESYDRWIKNLKEVAGIKIYKKQEGKEEGK